MKVFVNKYVNEYANAFPRFLPPQVLFHDLFICSRIYQFVVNRLANGATCGWRFPRLKPYSLKPTAREDRFMTETNDIDIKPNRPSSTGLVRNVPADMTNWREKVQLSRLKFDDIQKKIYLAALTETGLKGVACAEAGVSDNTVTKHMADDPDFAEAREMAITAYRDTISAIVHHLAVNGAKTRFLDAEGKMTSEKVEPCLRMIEMEAKRVNPEYRDKQTIDVNTNGGGVLIAPDDQTPDEWIKKQASKDSAKKQRD